jgi:uncharacterized protein YoxC
MFAFHHGSELLLQIATQVAQSASHVYPDTIITKQVTAEPGIFEKIASMASLLMTVALLVLAVGLVPAAWNFRKTYKKVNDLIDRIYGDVTPLVRSASIVTEDVREIVASVKGDARMVQQTVAAANTRLLKAVRQTEARIDRFNALLEVVQEEAESTFISTAATVRGVRTGFGQIFTHEGDDDDGDIGDARSHETGDPDAGPARPRVRPKRHEPPFDSRES